jgi:anti-anti-sigma factor
MNGETGLLVVNIIAESKMEFFQFILNDAVHISLIGQLWQKEELSALSDAIDSCIHQQQNIVVLDLQRLSFISNQGLGLLVRIHSTLEAAGGNLILNCNNSDILELFRISGFGEFMKIVNNQIELQQILASIPAKISHV